jgi:hypothetical protein
MKKVYVLGLFLIMFGGSAFAQDKVAGSFKGGLKINPSFMWLKTEPEQTGTTIENVGAYFGFSYGVFGDYYFAENYGLSTELRIAHLGAEYNYTPMFDEMPSNPVKVATVNRNMDLQYVEIPVTLKMRTNEVGYMRYFGQFGFMPAINIKAKADDVYTMYDNSKIEENDKKIGKEVNPLALSLVIGAGVEYNLGGSTSLLGGITFNNGFTNLINKKEDDQSTRSLRNFNAKPAYIALNLGVIF